MEGEKSNDWPTDSSRQKCHYPLEKFEQESLVLDRSQREKHADIRRLWEDHSPVKKRERNLNIENPSKISIT